MQFPGATDDSYYLSKAAVIIRNDVLNPDIAEAANGFSEDSSFIRADVSSWPVYLAYWARLFHINPTILAHVSMGIIVIVISFCITISIADKICHTSLQKRVFFVIYYLLALCTINIPDLWQEFWIIRYSWYGVAIVNILLYCFLDSIIFLHSSSEEYIFKMSYWVYILFIFLACVQSEIVGIFIAPCFCIGFGFPYLVKLGWKKVKKLLPFALLLGIPAAVFACNVFYQIHSQKINQGILGLSTDYTWFYWIDKLFLNNLLFYVWVLCCVYLVFRGTVTTRWVFIGGSATLALTFFNPLLYSFISNYITSNTVYYRIYWCIPILYMITFAVSDLWMCFPKRRKIVSGIILLLIYVGLFNRTNIFKDASFASNQYKLDGHIIQIADYILSHSQQNEIVRVVAPQELQHYLRQYSSDIIYPCSVRSSGSEIVNGSYSYSELYQRLYYNEFEYDLEALELLQRLETDYIIYKTENGVPEMFDEYFVNELEGYSIISMQK